MKKILIIISIIILNHFFVSAQNTECSRVSDFGSKAICLPNIKGYQECYTIPMVKELADATESPMNAVLGFYLNNEVYSKKDSLGSINFDDYFKIYGTKQIQNITADNSTLEQMTELLSSNFISKNWDEMSQEIDKMGLDTEIGVPIVVDDYKINDESFTIVMLTKYASEGYKSHTLAMTINGYLANERLVWMAYYLQYTNQETINHLKDKSDYILQKLIDANK